MSIFDDHTGDILDGLRNPAWELPDYEPNGAANPKGDAAYWRARAEKAEAGWRNCIDLHCEAEARAEAAEAEAARMREVLERARGVLGDINNWCGASEGYHALPFEPPWYAKLLAALTPAEEEEAQP